MAFRTVIVKTPSKLELCLGYLVYRTVEESIKIYISEIHTLIIESTAVSITSALISELVKNKVKIIFCDAEHNPASEVVPYYNNVGTSKNVHLQVNWNEQTIGLLWKLIIEQKLKWQSYVLRKYGFEETEKKILEYSNYIEPHDVTNREGHAAKIYFNNLFGENFSRSSENIINAFLNYGYTILLSQFNREIVSLGYITQLGIHHKSVHNQFNLSCDLMEPFRPIVDDKAKTMSPESDFKKELVSLLNIEVEVDGKKQTLYNAIHIYVSSIFSALENNDLSKVKFMSNYEI